MPSSGQVQTQAIKLKVLQSRHIPYYPASNSDDPLYNSPTCPYPLPHDLKLTASETNVHPRRRGSPGVRVAPLSAVLTSGLRVERVEVPVSRFDVGQMFLDQEWEGVP